MWLCIVIMNNSDNAYDKNDISDNSYNIDDMNII